MFTGIITETGTIVRVQRQADLRVEISASPAMCGVALGGSIACSGACLTLIGRTDHAFLVDVSAETVARTRAGQWTEGTRLNLEHAVKMGDELGGHLVTGHVDGVGTVISAVGEGGSLRLGIQVGPDIAPYVASKGSVTIDGVSLTLNTVEDGAEGTVIGLNIIPHTAEITTLGALQPGDCVNVEIDLIARYLVRLNSYAAR